MSPRLFLIPLLLSSAACAPGQNTGEKGSEPGLLAKAMAVGNEDALANVPVIYVDKEANGKWLREFSYKWPAVVKRHPDLAKVLVADRTAILTDQKAEAAQAVKDSPADCPGCGNRSYLMEWKVVTDTPRMLSLSGAFSTYTGGAHGMSGMRSLVWDKSTKVAMDGVALFRSPADLEAALGPRLCAVLDDQRARKRGAPIGGTGAFEDCPHVSDATVLVGSSTKQAFDRMTLWFGPYVAGPYAEGPYELNFPVDAAILAAVRPEFAALFKAKP